MTMNRLLVVLTLGLLTVAGCSSSKNATDDGTPPYYLGAFEDFDPDAYEDVTPPIEPAVVDHDIPDKLETPARISSSTVRGFRIQVFSSLNRTEANDAMQQAITWWEDNGDRREAKPPIYMEYEQPYYKVRAGNFKSRDAASRMATKIDRVFAGAFVVPSMIETR